MKQIALDIGLAPGPSLANFLAGQNQLVLEHLSLWVSNQVRSPVPTYLWGEVGCGKSHLLQAVRAALGEQGGLGSVGWMDPQLAEPGAFSEDWQVVLLDDVHLYNAVQQHAAFNWFVNATSATDGQQRWVLASGSMPPVIYQCERTCAPAWPGATCFSCSCSAKLSVVQCCASMRMPGVCF